MDIESIFRQKIPLKPLLKFLAIQLARAWILIDASSITEPHKNSLHACAPKLATSSKTRKHWNTF
jgi:hypothetical protein